QRAYTVRPSSLTATCVGAIPTCRVKGTMSWKFHAGNTTTHGAASFEYSIVLDDAGAKVAAETSSAKQEPPAAASPSSLGQVGKTIQHLLAKLSKPAAKATKTKASTKAIAKPSAKASTNASVQAATRPPAPVAR